MMKNFLLYLSSLVALVILLNVLVVRRGQVPFPAEAGPVFNADINMEHRDQISAEQPQIILLGDSMVQENIDVPALSESLGRTIHRIGYPGAASAMWYLSLKNNILLSPHRPQALVILFRDSTLTAPSYRVGKRIDSLAGADEELLIRLAYLDRMNPLERTARRYFPWYIYGFKLRDLVDFANLYALPRLVLYCGKRCVDTAFIDTFSFRTRAAPTANDEIAKSESVLYTAQALDFYGQVEDSFLPEMIRLCNENGIPLILVRARTISFVDLPKPWGLDGYILELKEYLRKNGVLFADMEGDARLGSEDFMDRYHVQPEARGVYTQMLAEALLPLLP